MKALITGTSSGLGRALAAKLKSSGFEVYGINRTEDNEVNNINCNLAHIGGIKPSLESLSGVDCFDIVFLNAGELGRLSTTTSIDMEEFQRSFDINVFSNKVIVDYLVENKKAKNIIGISSGAALKPYYGWSLYCCTKAAFKQLLSTYALENKDITFINLAPGIIKTKMQDFINEQDEDILPSVKKFKDMYDTMDSPDIVANKIFDNLDLILKLDSGSYFDMRDINV